MYIHPSFKIEDREVIDAFIRKNSFGLLLTIFGSDIHDTHTPFVISDCGSLLIGHIARANEQWKNWDSSTTAKVIFTGEHAYVSPHYYESEFNVPTWNYTAVSVSGVLSIISDESEVLQFLEDLTALHERETDAWKLNREDERYLKLLSGIVVFRISIDKIEASFKLNQNKSFEDQSSVINSLSQSACPFDHKVAATMQSNLKNKTEPSR